MFINVGCVSFLASPAFSPDHRKNVIVLIWTVIKSFYVSGVISVHASYICGVYLQISFLHVSVRQISVI